MREFIAINFLNVCPTLDSTETDAHHSMKQKNEDKKRARIKECNTKRMMCAREERYLQ
jgi:hypothetical protein